MSNDDASKLTVNTWSTVGTVQKAIFAVGAVVLLWAVDRCSGESPLVRQMMSAEMLMWDGQYDRAIDAYSQMIKDSPTWSWPYNGRGETYRRMGDLDHAFADLNEAIRLKPDFYEAFYSRCRAYQAKGDLNNAIIDCEQSLRIKPDQYDVENIIARIQFSRGDLDLAAQRFGHLILVNDAFADPYFYRGQILLFHSNKPAEAANDFAAGLKHAFSYRETAKTLSVLDENKTEKPALMSPDHPFFPDAIYLILWAHVARAQAGQDDAAELAENFEQLRRPIWLALVLSKFENVTAEVEQKTLAPWPAPIFALYLGKATPDSVRALAQSSPDPEARQRRICDADFYLGEYALQKHSDDEARKLLHAAADQCPAAARERAFAAAELKRLGQ